MSDYIDREAIMRKFADHVRRSNNSDFAQTPTWNQAVQIVEDSPAADVAPVVHGRWIDDKGNFVPWDEMNKNCPRYSAFCSVCGEWLTASDEYPTIGNFCPNCGAKMDKVSE